MPQSTRVSGGDRLTGPQAAWLTQTRQSKIKTCYTLSPLAFR
ncbi:hypothetical protein [Nodosilinea nodulosa]|nr:hypothetical protein [Nodosilinea nodulosa]